MLFTIGVESPDNEEQAYGLIVPALHYKNYRCISAADTVDEILPTITEAITSILEMMVEEGIDITEIKDQGFSHYKTLEDYDYCDSWLLVNVDVSEYLGKKHRVNISMPEYLLNRIDRRVAALPNIYKDRSAFLANAAHRELYALAGTEM